MSKDIYVRNLSQQTTEEDLRTLFAVAGKVTYIHLVIDPKTEQFLGCAYVKMSSEAEARDAISALNEARYMNAYISVSQALPRTPPGSPRPAAEKKSRPPAPTAAERKQNRAIVKGDWTGPGPAKKKDRAPLSPRPPEGAAGRKSPAGRTGAPPAGKIIRTRSEEGGVDSDWTAPGPVRKGRPPLPPRRPEGEFRKKVSADGTTSPERSKPSREKRVAGSDWSAPAPAPAERTTPFRGKRSGAALRSAPKKGPVGPKRGK